MRRPKELGSSRRRPSHRQAASTLQIHALADTANGARVRLCILMAGHGGTAIDFIANCIQPCCSLSGKVPLAKARASPLASQASERARKQCGNGDVLIRSANKSARKRVVGEDNKCIANSKIIGARCASRTTGRLRRVIKPERFRPVISRRLKIASRALGISLSRAPRRRRRGRSPTNARFCANR